MKNQRHRILCVPNLTVSVDEELMKQIRAHPGINWSHVAREAFRRKARELHMWDVLLADSEMTEQDAVQAGDETKVAVLRRLGW